MSQNSCSDSIELLWFQILRVMVCNEHIMVLKAIITSKLPSEEITKKKYKPLGGVRLTPFLRHHCIGKIPKESAWQSIEILLGSGLKSSMVTCK